MIFRDATDELSYYESEKINSQINDFEEYKQLTTTWIS
jgi:hypothetical protein